MQVQVETISDLERKIKVTIPAEEVDGEADKKLSELNKKVKIPGFRPGKIPPKILKQKYGTYAREEVIAKIVEASYYAALDEKKLHPAGQPKIEPEDTTYGKDLIYTASFEVVPEIKLVPLDGAKITKEIAEVTEEDIIKAVEKIRKDHATWEEVKREPKVGDQLVIDFAGTIKGESFKGGSAKDFKFELGSGEMLEAFEKNLSKLTPGEEIKFKLKFPKDYFDANVAGKKAEFTVKLHKVLEAKLPEVNDEFCRTIGIKEGGVAELHANLRKNMENDLKTTLANDFKHNVMDKVLELNPIELPKVMVEEEIKAKQTQLKRMYATYAGGKVEDFPDAPRENFEKDSKRNVHLGLVLSEFINQKQLKADEAKVKEKIREIASRYENPEEIILHCYKDKNQLRSIEIMVLEEQAIDELTKQVEVVEKKVTFDEVMNPKE